MAKEAGAFYKIGKMTRIKRNIFDAYLRAQRRIPRINKMWLQLGILGLIFAAMMVVMLTSAELQVRIDIATEKLKAV